MHILPINFIIQIRFYDNEGGGINNREENINIIKYNIF